MTAINSFVLSNIARSKLSEEAQRQEPRLRILLGHAIIVDRTEDFNNSIQKQPYESGNGITLPEERTIHPGANVAEGRDEEWEADDFDSDSDSSSGSDGYIDSIDLSYASSRFLMLHVNWGEQTKDKIAFEKEVSSFTADLQGLKLNLSDVLEYLKDDTHSLSIEKAAASPLTMLKQLELSNMYSIGAA